MTRLVLLLAVVSSISLSGCGQSGPLYLPGDPSQIRDVPQPVESAGEEDGDDER